MTSEKPHIILIIARGEAVHNILYSDTLAIIPARGDSKGIVNAHALENIRNDN